MGLKNLTISMILIMFFVIGIVLFGSGLASDNNAKRSILDDSTISGLESNVSTTTGQYQDDATGGIQAYVNSSAVVGGDSPQKDTEESTFRAVYTVPFQAFNVALTFVFVKLFGGDTAFKIIFTVISSFIAILFIAYVIKAIRSGEV